MKPVGERLPFRYLSKASLGLGPTNRDPQLLHRVIVAKPPRRLCIAWRSTPSPARFSSISGAEDFWRFRARVSFFVPLLSPPLWMLMVAVGSQAGRNSRQERNRERCMGVSRRHRLRPFWRPAAARAALLPAVSPVALYIPHLIASQAQAAISPQN